MLFLLCFLTSSSVTGNGFGPRSRQIWQYLGMLWVATTVEETKRVRNLIVRGQNAAKPYRAQKSAHSNNYVAEVSSLGNTNLEEAGC